MHIKVPKGHLHLHCLACEAKWALSLPSASSIPFIFNFVEV